MSSQDEDRCRALTEDGERCSRPAQEDGFCHQHDESDPTIDDESTDDGTSDTDGDRPRAVGSEIMEVRESVRAIGRDLIGHELDNIIEMEQGEGGWQVTVEVVERPAVPDTQDILGRYEVEFDSDRSVSGYRRIGRYRRADRNPDDLPE